MEVKIGRVIIKIKKQLLLIKWCCELRDDSQEKKLMVKIIVAVAATYKVVDKKSLSSDLQASKRFTASKLKTVDFLLC